ncbi:hypothetical protein QYE76_012145 [Lolium multiflorum]|uniref:Uncharacterized protein n=1 Tax=Lolium multiflorum TaxID=4521 RepID=A0AAD8X3E5_LOLMU|nr:hypothetical protein QYE76_012145 [Lolium multiflorum]
MPICRAVLPAPHTHPTWPVDAELVSRSDVAARVVPVLPAPHTHPTWPVDAELVSRSDVASRVAPLAPA